MDYPDNLIAHEVTDKLIIDLLSNQNDQSQPAKISVHEFYHLLELISPMLNSSTSSDGNILSHSGRLAVTLQYLTKGCSFATLQQRYHIAYSYVKEAVQDVCDAIIKQLSSYVKVPNNEQNWQEIAKIFRDRWNFYPCIGAIDVKHFFWNVSNNSNNGNSSTTNKLVLVALVDANYNYLYVHTSSQGGRVDDKIFKDTSLYRAILNNSLKLPTPRALPGRKMPIPYLIVADEAFQSSPNLITPFPGTHWIEGSVERMFNYRLNKARHVVEHAFGILSDRFRILSSTLYVPLDRAIKIVLACVTLHNFFRRSANVVKKIDSATGASYQDNTCNKVSTSIPNRCGSEVQYGQPDNSNIKCLSSTKDVRMELAEFYANDEIRFSRQ